MLPGRRTDNGALFVTEAPLLDLAFSGGIAVSAAGVIYVSSTLLPQVFVNGFGLRHTGQLCIAYGGTIKQSLGGLPFTADGRLVCQLNVAPWPGDSYTSGIRVGPLGGVYVVDIVPPELTAFSPGFDEGFQ